MSWSTPVLPPPTRRPKPRSSSRRKTSSRSRLLQQPTAGYLLMSCKDHDDPPYQGAVYLDFLLPRRRQRRPVFPDHRGGHGCARLARGFTAQPAHVRQKSVEGRRQRDPLSGSRLDDARRRRIYGQCHDMNSHRGDRRRGSMSPTDCISQGGNRKPGLTGFRQARFCSEGQPPAWAPSAPCRSAFIALSCAPQYSQLWVP